VTDVPTPEGLRARVDEELAAGWEVAVAKFAGTVVGFVALRPDLGKLDQIFVAPDRHGQGIGRALFAHAREAMPQGFYLRTHADNGRAQRFYDALGPVRQEPGRHPTYGHPILTYWFAGAIT
jgi:ribosomal protein S18 acetylase RimI-like enzyme